MRSGAVIVGAAIIGVAGVMAYVWSSGGDCAGGTVLRSIDQCVASGRTGSTCNELMGAANAMLARTGPVSSTREQCEGQYGTCQQSHATEGFVPRASGFCLSSDPKQHIVPLYGPR
ncbi:DUF1190 domain-containing protein [Phreatobacter aquaticus]|uniref:DUF1190 domain-containing protein n=1 Tax=Phreatobacter aquaticus TaxID=2570229 RepID=A0A4D7QPW3_9HYPH|nr:DUF1190 domain-containing protein [Phreatobacter aquaticus]QCK87656.1 DUF1190 domain-containing protein [Phreatobacter aquaticus]